MKNYGLITIHDTQNYGSLLQTYGLYKAIYELTGNIELIDYRNDAISKRESRFSLSECRSIKDFLKYLFWHRDMERRYQALWNFMRTKMRVSRQFNKDNISEANNSYDTYIVGSDIVWGMEITGNDYTYFLDFAADNKEKIAFSSSVGNKWENDVCSDVQRLLKRFNHISVREDSAVNWIEELGIDAKNTCDPTMLWDGDEWRKYIDSSIVPSKKYVLIYMADSQKKNVRDAIAYAKKNNLEVYYINFYSKHPKTKSIKPYSMEQWLALIDNAECVFTSSYHGLMFSLYFHKQVFFYNNVYKSRMASLCEELQIRHREGTDVNLSINQELDYHIVDEKIEQKRQYAWGLLKDWIKED